MKYSSDVKINIPNDVLQILNEIEEYGERGYVVGGCVRDSLLGKKPHDWDISSPVPAQKLIKYFKKKGYKTIPAGMKHGTIAVILNGNKFEITTFRKDGEYSDGRHPDSVEWTDDLKEDLMRRDFTINAMAYHPDEGLIDLYGGLEDLENKIIRCVGNADERIKEDSLRIMRAIRFSAKYGYNIHRKTVEAIHKNCRLLNSISNERIISELNLILKSRYNLRTIFSGFSDVLGVIIPPIKSMFYFKQNNPYHIYDAYSHTLHTLDYVRTCDLITSLAALFHDIGKPYCYQDGEDGVRHFKGHAKVSAEITDREMRRLRYDNDTREKVVELVKYHDATLVPEKKNIKRWLNKIGDEQFRRLIELQYADAYAHDNIAVIEKVPILAEVENLLKKVLDEKECFSIKNLAVNGKDIMDTLHIGQCKEIGSYLNKLLDLVMEGSLQNNREDLLSWVSKNSSCSV